MGGVDFISKPFEAAELLARVMTHLTLRRQELELKRYAGELEEMVAERTRQLVHADRLATLGTFAAGIVHEINTPLTYIGGNAELLQVFWKAAKPLTANHAHEDQTGRVGRVDSYLEAILEGQQRIKQIVEGLKTYSRKEERPKHPCPLLDPVKEAADLLNHRLKKGVAVEMSIPPEIRILCDRQKISQVFVNLFTNALDAMGGMTGRISIQAGKVADRVRILVGDSGPGIPEVMAEAVFSPFFTSKTDAGGTGLGLYIVRQIIEEHGGTIVLTSSDGMGATFLIELPLG